MAAAAFVVILLAIEGAVVGGFTFPAKMMTLERAFPHGGQIEPLKSRDGVRHVELLKGRRRKLGVQVQVINNSRAVSSSPSPGVVDFPVDGSSNPFSVGLYFTRVKLGNPMKEFYVQIDTGSDVLWVTCSSCIGCPTTSGLNLELEFFDPKSSSSSSIISCSDQRCSYGIQTSDSMCSSSNKNSECMYKFQYGDGSGTSGYYVSDSMHFDTVVGNGMILNSSAKVLFGCSNTQTGDLTKSDRAVDGILGLGQAELSVVSQLSSIGASPRVFSHCLKGTNEGGGILVFGEIVEPGIVYTPIVKDQPHYNLNLQSISINGKTLPISSSLFTTSNAQGTIIDSGTTLAYLADKVYDPFVNAITSAVSIPSSSSVSNGSQCFITYSSISIIFPSISLNFEGSAPMVLKPEHYLIQQGTISGAAIWCIGVQKNEGQEITILGDLILKDRIVVYDLVGQRIGWTDYDCSLPVNVSSPSSSTNEFVNAGQYGINNSPSTNFAHFYLVAAVTVILLQIFLFPFFIL